MKMRTVYNKLKAKNKRILKTLQIYEVYDENMNLVSSEYTSKRDNGTTGHQDMGHRI